MTGVFCKTKISLSSQLSCFHKLCLILQLKPQNTSISQDVYPTLQSYTVTKTVTKPHYETVINRK